MGLEPGSSRCRSNFRTTAASWLFTCQSAETVLSKERLVQVAAPVEILPRSSRHPQAHLYDLPAGSQPGRLYQAANEGQPHSTPPARFLSAFPLSALKHSRPLAGSRLAPWLPVPSPCCRWRCAIEESDALPVLLQSSSKASSAKHQVWRGFPPPFFWFNMGPLRGRRRSPLSSPKVSKVVPPPPPVGLLPLGQGCIEDSLADIQSS